MRFVLRAAAALAAGFLVTLAAPAGRASEELARGEYLSRIMDCAGCHVPGALIGQPDMAKGLSGSDVGFFLPDLGYFYPPNLTSDEETGLGTWTEDDIIRAVRTGVRPDGRELAPIMPWHAYSALTDEDARALARYLKSLPPVRHRAPGPFGPTETPTAPYLTVVVPQN